jgi:hypothetical protein
VTFNNWIGCVSTPEGAEAYLNGKCKKCLVRPLQAGSTMCYECWPLRAYSAPAPTDPVLTITDEELAQVEAFADAVMERSYRRGYRPDNARKRTIEQERIDKINGFAAELLFCRWKGCPWTPCIDAFHSRPDVLDLYEIRTTHHDHGGLIVGDDEPCRGRVYVLVTGTVTAQSRDMTLRGWLWGQETIGGPRNKFGWRPSVLMPQISLHKMDTLP